MKNCYEPWTIPTPVEVADRCVVCAPHLGWVMTPWSAIHATLGIRLQQKRKKWEPLQGLCCLQVITELQAGKAWAAIYKTIYTECTNLRQWPQLSRFDYGMMLGLSLAHRKAASTNTWDLENPPLLTPAISNAHLSITDQAKGNASKQSKSILRPIFDVFGIRNKQCRSPIQILSSFLG